MAAMEILAITFDRFDVDVPGVFRQVTVLSQELKQVGSIGIR
jgi:hypothetical protein